MQISNHYNAAYNAFANKDIQNTGANTKSSFSETVAENTAEACSNEVRKKTSAVLESIGSQASDEVKNCKVLLCETKIDFLTTFNYNMLYESK